MAHRHDRDSDLNHRVENPPCGFRCGHPHFIWSSFLSPINTHHSFNNSITSNPISSVCDSRATSSGPHPRAFCHLAIPYSIFFCFSHSSKHQTVYTVSSLIPVCADNQRPRRRFVFLFSLIFQTRKVYAAGWVNFGGFLLLENFNFHSQKNLFKKNKVCLLILLQVVGTLFFFSCIYPIPLYSSRILQRNYLSTFSWKWLIILGLFWSIYRLIWWLTSSMQVWSCSFHFFSFNIKSMFCLWL